MGKEVTILSVPIRNSAEAIGIFNPSMIQVYTYNQSGTVTIDNNNHVIRIEPGQIGAYPDGI